MDIYDKGKRSELMSGIRSRDTGPELAVRKKLHSLGFRYSLHSRDLPGKPDIVMPKHSTVVFVHGCFWHRHRSCKKSRLPKTNTGFWRKKLLDNARRDERVAAQLHEIGWKVLVIWECETKRDDLGKRMSEFILGNSQTLGDSDVGIGVDQNTHARQQDVI